MCGTTTSKDETWSRGTNLRLPFAVNVMLNLSLTLASDHHQSSPNNIHTSSREQFMRTDKMITKGKISYDFLSNSLIIGNIWRLLWVLYVDIWA